jgi:lysophospholipase L1-like esterase
MFTSRHRTSSRKNLRALPCALVLAMIASGLIAPDTLAVTNPPPEIVVKPNSVAVHAGFGVTISERKITVLPGACWVNDRPVHMKHARVVALPPCPPQHFNNEQLTFSKDSRGGEYAVLPACIGNKETKLGVTDSLAANSVNLRISDGGRTLLAGKDYNASPSGVITKIKGGALQGVSKCYASYAVNMHRVDSIAVDESGNLRFATGNPEKWAALPPVVPANFLPLYNVYSTTGKNITAEDILGISHEPMPITLTKQREKNNECLKHVLEKLKQGKAVRIAFWGDSITFGTGASSPEQSYVSVFARALRQRYPKADITIDRQGLVNANTSIRGNTLYQDVLAKSPDLVIIEFLNDMLFPALTVGDRYVQLIKAMKMVKCDVLLIAPHLPSAEFVPETSPHGHGSLTYTKMVRTLVQSDPNTAFCDVAARWQHLPKEGLKGESLLVDGVHPSNRGHEIYAEELIKCF